MTLTPAERLDALAARGIMLYLTPNGELRAKCEPCVAHVLDAARPMVGHYRPALIAYLHHIAAIGHELATESLLPAYETTPRAESEAPGDNPGDKSGPVSGGG